MKRDLMDILACPTCKAEFDLKVDEENDSEIVRGTLTCKQCGEVYPITDTIPDLRPPTLRDTGGSDEFEDLDDFDDENQRPLLPILLGVALLVGFVVVALVLRRRRRKSRMEQLRDFAQERLSSIEMPKVNLPHVDVPKMSMPHMEMPAMSLPHMEMPDVEIPKNVRKAAEKAAKKARRK